MLLSQGLKIGEYHQGYNQYSLVWAGVQSIKCDASNPMSHKQKYLMGYNV